MGKNKCLSPTTRAQIVAHSQNGWSQREIAHMMHCSKTAVQQAIAHFKKFNNFVDKSRSGRPRVTSVRQDRLIHRAAVVNPLLRTSILQEDMVANGTRVSIRTIRNRLCQFNLGAYRPARKPLLTTKMKMNRLAFAKKYCAWTVEQWRNVMWSDESTFTQFYRTERWIRRPPGQRFTIPTVKHSPSIMVWGCFSFRGRGSLLVLEKNERVNANRYLQILQNHLLMEMAIHQCEIFQQDSAPCHTAKVCIKWFADHHIPVLEWPGNSPDLNPIEHLWSFMKQRVSLHRPSSLGELRTAILRVWETEIPTDMCENLVSSMPRRLAKVISARGGVTKY